MNWGGQASASVQGRIAQSVQSASLTRKMSAVRIRLRPLLSKETPDFLPPSLIQTVMDWLILIIAGLCECGFTFCLGVAKMKQGWEHTLWIAGFVVMAILSMALLTKAAHHLPIGTAYVVWTGIGAVGTALLGIFVFHEPATFSRLFFLTTLILSIIGLKIVSA